MRHGKAMGLVAAFAIALGASACGPGGEEDEDTDVVADVVPDSSTDLGVDVPSDLPAGSREYSGNINFREGSNTCNVAFSIVWDGTAFADVEAYGPGDEGVNRCEVQATPSERVPIEQVTLRFGGLDEATSMLHGTLALQFTAGGTVMTDTLDWRGPIPSPQTGFAGDVFEPYKNFTNIGWHVGAK
ncbi:MAG: hypothetical protein H6746_20110 [Deltaproteobacteria bacterium]|nr:hypothetical protein [Deltaproteobacteria bacterium]